MRLRSRFALTLALLVVPFALFLGFLQERLRFEAVERATVESVLARMDERGRRRCEARAERGEGGPPGRRGRGRRGRFGESFFAYSETFESALDGAPSFDPELRRALETGAESASKQVEWRGRPAVLAAVRMPWGTGPCAIVVVRRPVRGVGLWATVGLPLIVSLAAISMAVLAAGPIVRRIRRLTEAVRRAHDEPNTPLGLSGADEIAELAGEFERSRARDRRQMEALTKRDEALTDYIANTTHDLMLPLTVLKGHLVSLQKQLGSRDGAPTHLVESAIEEAHHLASVVQNLSAAAKLEAGETHLAFHRVPLNALVDRVVARHAPVAAQKGVELAHATPSEELEAEGDVTLLEQAVSNLVQNAIRYNDDGGHVAVVLERAAEERFRLRVADDGPGIPPEELARITERRFRGGAARSRHPHGLGLGLHIVRDVALRHGFELAFEPTEGGGLTVIVTGPLFRQ